MTLRIVLYSSGVTANQQLTDYLSNHQGLTIGTYYPGGLYGRCTFFIPGGIRDPQLISGGKRIEIFDGLHSVWEGEIDNTIPSTDGKQEGLLIECTGYWGALFKRRRWNKFWVDTRLTQDQWVFGNEAGQFTVNRIDFIKMIPNSKTFATGDDCRVVYTAPESTLIKRITYDYDLFQGTPTVEDWHIGCINSDTGGTLIGSLQTASGTGSFDGTIAAGCGSIYVELRASSGFKADIDNGAYSKWSNIRVSSELGTISLSEVMKDIREHVTEVSSDETHIATNNLVIGPIFMTWETIGDFMEKLSSYGDSTYNPWSIGVLGSGVAGTPNGKPVVYYEQYPTSSSYEYIVRLEDLVNSVSLGKMYDEIYNYIIVSRTDENGETVYYTPETYPNLKSTTSISYYGQRDYLLKLGSIGEADALNYGYRFRAINASPKWRLSGSLQVKGMIRSATSMQIPVSWVRAGKYIMVENFLQEANGSDIKMLITSTSYDETADTVTINVGSPDPLEVLAVHLKQGIT
jgi:hypothetical protein